MPIERRAERRLRRQQAETMISIFPQNEIGEPGTKHALAVKDDDGAVIGKRRNRRITSVTEGFVHRAPYSQTDLKVAHMSLGRQALHRLCAARSRRDSSKKSCKQFLDADRQV